MHHRTLLLAVLSIVALLSLLPVSLHAIPAFSYRENMSCSGCHTVYPQLNEMGTRYLANGFRIPDKDYSKADMRSLVSLSSEAWFAANQSGRSTDFQLHKVELLAGGAFGKRTSGFVEAYIEERGAPHEAGDVYIQLNNLGRIAGRSAGIRAGQFQPSLLNPDGQRLTVTRSLTYDTKTGNWRVRNRQRGVEFFVNEPDGSSYVLSVVNGNGNPPEKKDSSDDNNFKDIAISINKTLPWKLSGGSNSIGLYSYSGRQTLIPSAGSPFDDRFTRHLLQAEHARNDWKLYGVYSLGRNSNLKGDGTARRNRGGFVELNYFSNSNTVWILRADSFDPDTSDNDKPTRELVMGAARLLDQNVKLTAQYRLKEGHRNDQFLTELELNF